MKEIKKSFWDFISVGLSGLLAAPLMMLSEAIQAKHLGTNGYGKVGLVLSAISLLYLFGLNWLRFSIMRFGKQEFLQNKNIKKTSGAFFSLAIISSLIIISIFTAFKTPILRFLEIKNASSFWVILLGFYIVLGREFVFEVLKVTNKIKQQSFLQRLVPKFVIAGLMVFFAINLKLSVNVAIGIFIFSDFLSMLFGLFLINPKIYFPFKINKQMLIIMLVFSYPLLFSSWANHLVNWIDTYVIKYYLTLNDVGIYQSAYKILSSLKALFSSVLITIVTPIIIVFKTKNQINKVKNLYLTRIVSQISFVSSFFVLLLILCAKPVYLIVYPKSFLPALTSFKILLSSLSYTVVALALMPVVTSFDLTKQMLLLGVFSGITNIIADIALVKFFGINGAAFASFIVFALNSILWWFIIKKRFKIKRNMALFFPLLTSFSVLLSALNLNTIVWVVSSLAVFLLGFFIAKSKNLFNKDDVQFIQQIKMPAFLKKFITKVIVFLS